MQLHGAQQERKVCVVTGWNGSRQNLGSSNPAGLALAGGRAHRLAAKAARANARLYGSAIALMRDGKVVLVKP